VKTRGLGGNSLLALAGDGASKAGALLVVLLAARFLSVSEFALLATGLAAAGVLTSLLDLGSGTLLARDGARGRSERGALFRGLLRARVPLALAVLLAAPLVGLLVEHPLAGVAVALLGVSGALALSVLALYRSCQDLRPEAIQRLAAALLSVGAVVLLGLVLPRADALLGALALVTIVTLVPLLRGAPRIADLESSTGRAAALRLAAPIGLLALATVAYYRAGTLVLAVLADAEETAMFSVAASIAFGLLMVPNAITTALLPRLAAERSSEDRIACARRALGWTVAVAILVAAGAALVVPVALPVALGPEYRGAGAPFALLCVGVPLIAVSGVVGTTLLGVGRLRPLAVQVGLSLAVNLAALALLVPLYGAVGAALATVACELVGLVILASAARRSLPGLLVRRPSAIRAPARPSRAPAA